MIFCFRHSTIGLPAQIVKKICLTISSGVYSLVFVYKDNGIFERPCGSFCDYVCPHYRDPSSALSDSCLIQVCEDTSSGGI